MEPSASSIREYIVTEWAQESNDLLDVDFGRVNDHLLELLTTNLKTAIVQQAGTNGHCYGMALAAQAYFEAPETIPIDRAEAASIHHPAEPLSDATAPIYHEIVQLQAAQFLRFRSWLGRRMLLWPDRIDVASQLDDICAVIDVFGTAQVSLFDSRTSGHQVLAYDYDDRRDGLSLYVYDPNFQSATYEHGTRVIEFDRRDDGFVMDPYDTYEWMLFNRYDRIEDATDREPATPADHVDLDAVNVREAIFPTALVTVDTAAVDLAVDDPNGGRLGRLRSDFMNLSRGPVARVRSTYGADAGTYRIRLYGHESTQYELQVRIAGPDGARLSVTETARIDAGETQEFVATVPNSATETGSFEPDDRNPGRVPATAMAAAGGVAAGAGAHYLWSRHTQPSSTDDET